jgi:peptidoglycan hydrolase CwlO-like protein
MLIINLNNMANEKIKKALEAVGDSCSTIEAEVKSIRSELDSVIDYIVELEDKIDDLEELNENLNQQIDEFEREKI